MLEFTGINCRIQDIRVFRINCKRVIKILQIIEKEGKKDYIFLIVTYMTIAGETREIKDFLNILENSLSEKTGEGIRQ